MVKPVLKFLSRKHRTNLVTPSTCNYDVVESVQNDLNESELFQLHFKFYEARQEECDENAKNEALENRLRESAGEKDLSRMGVQRRVDGEIVVEPVACGTYLAIPVHFVESTTGEFMWAPLPDRDVRGDDSPICGHQRPEQQVPVCITAA